jgi:rubrerythrin
MAMVLISMDVENWTIEKALKTGAEMELESYTLYTKTAETAKYPGAKKLLTEIAEDEKRHRDYFLKGFEDPANIKARTLQEESPDLKITDRLVNVPLDENADYQTILMFAAKREKTTHDFYVQIARRFKDTEWGKMFNNFATEELRHKYLLEKEYDDVVLAEM